MKFGHAVSEELDQISWELPTENPINHGVLPGKKTGEPKVYVGCGKWGIKEWVGFLYPEKTPASAFLAVYSNQFNSVELNNTFYRTNRNAMEEWSQTVEGKDFTFCPKFSRRVSHLRRLNDDSLESTDYFIESALLFGKHLGTSFLQMPDNFAPKYIDRFYKWTERIPTGFPVFVELRHSDWFQPPAFEEICDLFRKKGVGLVITDTALRRDVIHMSLTIPQAFIRFNGYGLHPSDYKRLDDWAEITADWIDRGLEKIFFFGHQSNEKHTPVICRHYLEAVEKRTGLALLKPQIPT